MSNFGTPIGDALKSPKRRFTLLQTGDTGHGKTTRALTASQFGPVYVFDFDGKLEGAARTLQEKDQKLIFFDNYADKGFIHAYTKLKELKALYDKGEKPFATIVVDTFTLLNEKAYVKAMGRKLEQPGAKASFDEWGIIKNDLSNFFNIFSDLPCNLIINAHIAKGESVEGKQILSVDGQGRFRDQLSKRMTDSHYLYFELGKWKVRAKKSASLPCNSNLPDKFFDQKGNLNVEDLSVFAEYAYNCGKIS